MKSGSRPPAPRSASTGVRSVNYATSPLLASKTPPWRSRLVVLLVGGAFAVLLGRAVYVQIIATEFYQAQGEKRFVFKQPLSAQRGRILDRNGLVLATSVAMPSVQVDAKTFSADVAQRRQLAKLLGLTSAELTEKLDGATGTVTLRRHLDEAAWKQVAAMKLKGLQEVREFQRRYPEGEAAAHIVGFTDIDNRKGLEGIERSFQKELEGKNGQRSVVRDRLGRVVEDIGDQASAVNGSDVTLSIDSKVQFFAYQRLRDAVREHGAKAGSVVVLDTQTGQVLALANYPSYNPAKRTPGGFQQMRNLALTDTFEPGSTMKPFTAALAIETRRVTKDTIIDTAPGRMTITGSTITDAHVYGQLTVTQVIQKSSNVGTVKMAMQMPAREIWEQYSAIGMGQKPRLDFPGVVTGRLRPYKSWRPIEQATMSYGYGLSASLFQLARAYTVFARDGEIIPVTLQAADNQIVAGQRVMSAETARQVREMLHLAAGPGGTAPKAQAIGYSVGGKSGTARKQIGKTYSNKYRAWFVGLAPVSNPRIVVAVMIDEPSKGVFYGGQVAAPVFSQVVQQTLRMMNVAPDIEVKPQIQGKPELTVQEST